jgi:hypothetical protein
VESRYASSGPGAKTGTSAVIMHAIDNSMKRLSGMLRVRAAFWPRSAIGVWFLLDFGRQFNKSPREGAGVRGAAARFESSPPATATHGQTTYGDVGKLPPFVLQIQRQLDKPPQRF